MRQAVHTLAFDTPGRGLIEITRPVDAWTRDQRMTTGLLTLFCRHTSASLLIQENAAPAVLSDIEAFFETLAPEAPGRYRHDDEGPDDMPAHLRAALTGVQLAIPVIAGALRSEPGRESTCSSTAAPRTGGRWRPIWRANDRGRSLRPEPFRRRATGRL